MKFFITLPFLVMFTLNLHAQQSASESDFFDRMGSFNINKKGEIVLNIDKPVGTYTPGTNPMTYTSKGENLNESIFVEKSINNHISRVSHYSNTSDGEQLETDSYDENGNMTSGTICSYSVESKVKPKKFGCLTLNRKICAYANDIENRMTDLDKDSPQWKKLDKEIKQSFDMTLKIMTNDDFLKNKPSISKSAVYKKDLVVENKVVKSNNELTFLTVWELCKNFKEESEKTQSTNQKNIPSSAPAVKGQ